MEDQSNSNNINDPGTTEHHSTSEHHQIPSDLNTEGFHEIVRTAASVGATIHLSYNPQNFVDNRQTHTHEYHTEGAYKPQFVGGDLINQPSNQQPTGLHQSDSQSIEPTPDPSVLLIEAASSRNEQIAVLSSFPAGEADQNNEQIAALEKLSRLQQKYKEPNVMLLGLETSQENIPIVHPKMVEASVMKRKNAKHEPYIPSTEKCEDIQYEKEINFETLINKAKGSNFVTLIGGPGAGKSTLSRRIVEANGCFCFLLKFMDMNVDANDELTLRQLLLDNKYGNELTERELELIFDWVIAHDDECIFILEGYDQSQWSFNKNANQRGCKKPQTVKSLISNLCHKKFLPRSHIILTSRPHSITSIPASITSNCTILLQDLSFENMKKLFSAFAGTDDQQVWNKLHARAPQLVSACLNPLMLQLIVKACLSSSAGDIGVNTTMTRVFATILTELRHSSHTRLDDINTILDKLCILAFRATLKRTVVMTLNDLKAVGLDIRTAQDLVMATFTHLKGCIKVFEGDAVLFFCHQTVQEYLTARYISKLMSYDDFKEFVATKLFTPHWIVVRHFLFGIILDLKLLPDAERNIAQQSSEHAANEKPQCSKSPDSTDRVNKTTNSSRSTEKQTRAEILLKKFMEMMAENPSERDLIDLCHDVREANSDHIANKAADRFPEEADLSEVFISLSDAHALSCVIKKIDKKMKKLKLMSCHLTTEQFHFICEAIQEMKGTIDELDIGANFLSSSSIDDVIAIMSKINVNLVMDLSFDGGGGIYRNLNTEERYQIQSVLNELPYNLEVVVEWFSSDDNKILSKQSIVTQQ